MQTELIQQLEERGYRARIVSIRRLADLQEGIQGPYREGLLDPAFCEERLTGFAFQPPEDLSEARSLIIVALAQPQIRFSFSRKGVRTRVLVPPTYLRWQETDAQVQAAVAEILSHRGFGVAQVRLPKKLLAVRSGLAAYGRNNVTYVPEMGSFHRLVALCSDLPIGREDWQQPRMMERCQTCRACMNKCPSGAIPDDRFLLRAERCIVFHNEHPGHVPFPAWLDPSWHNCLVGCMLCQQVCPENRDVLDWVEEGATFSAQETALLLEGTPLDQLPGATVRKLEQWDLVDLLDILPRNLGVLLPL